MQAPATIADNLSSQLVELQNTIAARESGKRYPTSEEADIMRKLVAALDKLKKNTSLAQNMQMIETLRNFLRPLDKEFTGKFADYSRQFLKAQSLNGYVPYEMEYGVSPISPFYDEPAENDVDYTMPELCFDKSKCLHPGHCNFPHCALEQKVGPETKYGVPAIHYTAQQEIRNMTPLATPGPAESRSDSATPPSETAEKNNSYLPRK